MNGPAQAPAATEVRFDLAVPVRWGNEPPEADREAVEAVIRAAVARAVARVAGAAAPGGTPAAPAAASTPGASAPPAERARYGVPSYDDGGEPVELPVEEAGEPEEWGEPTEPWPEEGADGPAETLLPHTSRPAAEDAVEEGGPHPLEGRLLAIFPGHRAIKVSSRRRAMAGELARAIAWGRALFGSRSWAVLEGPLPLGRGGDRYHVVATGEAVSSEDLRLQELGRVAGEADVGSAASVFWVNGVEGADGETYLLRALFTVEGDVLFPPSRALVEEYLTQLRSTSREEAALPASARDTIFGDIDRLLAEGRRDEAVERLVELDAYAFALMGFEAKARYLVALLDGWPGDREEQAVIEIFKSFESRSDLDAARELLAALGKVELLFSNLDRVWSLLVVVGRRFGAHRPFTFDRLMMLLDEAGLVPSAGELALTAALPGVGPLVTGDMVAEAEEAALSFVRFLGGAYDSVEMLLTEPGKVVEGLAQIVRLSIAAQLAALGHKESRELVEGVLGRLGDQVLAGLEGVEVLGGGETLVRRIKWALIWEVASYFIGVGEVKAALSAAGFSRRLLALARITRILGLSGDLAGTGRAVLNLERLLTALAHARPWLGNADEVAHLVSRLPEDEVRRLAGVLDRVELEEGLDLARLASRSPELAEVAEDLAQGAEALRLLAVKAGGLTDEVARAYGRLTRVFHLGADDVTLLAGVLPEGAGPRFLAALARLPSVQRTVRGAAVGDLLLLVAASERRIDAALFEGWSAVVALYRRSGGRGRVLDGYLDALDELRLGLPVETRASEYRRFLARLEADDTEAWVRLESGRRAAAGEPTLGGVAEALADDFLAEAGFKRLLRGRHDALLNELVEDVLPESPGQFRALMGRIGSLSDEQVRGLAVAHRVDDHISGPHRWSDVLDLDRDHRGELLALLARVDPALGDGAGLGRLLTRGLAPPGTNVQGTLGHLWAVRTLQRRHPGARMELELDVPGREIDVRLSAGGRRIDVEVKTGLAADPPISRRQIRKDLARHVGDRFEDLLYLYHPDQAAVLGGVRQAMLDALGHPDVSAALSRAGVSRATAEGWLRRRFDEGLVDTYAFE